MYYSRIIRKSSAIVNLFKEFLRKDIPFRWNARIKANCEIASEIVFISYTPKLLNILASYGSSFGLSGVLSHRLPDRSEKLIAFVPRSLTATESRLDTEATVFIEELEFYRTAYLVEKLTW